MVGGESSVMAGGQYIEPVFRALLDRIDAGVPGQCAVCRAWPARSLCDGCVARFGQPVHRCSRCALPMASDQPTCGRCLREPPPLDACHAAVDYGFPWSSLVAEFKFRGAPGWARTFAVLMRSAPWIEAGIERADVVVPMPLARQRLRERGFNQSALLARELAPRKSDSALLLRIRDTAAQASLDLKGRRANVRGAFAVDPARAATLRGARVALVDDVMTSGASIHAAARALAQAGAAHVSAMVFARTDEPQ
jgi:ComF family protein